MKSCTKRYTDLPFAHRQWRHDGHCKHIHGHNWTFEFEFRSSELDKNGFVIDFGRLKWLKEALEARFDHTCVLCEDDPFVFEFFKTGGSLAWNIFTVPDASCEGLAQWLFGLVNANIFSDDHIQRGVCIYRVTVFEDSKNSATFYSQ